VAASQIPIMQPTSQKTWEIASDYDNGPTPRATDKPAFPVGAFVENNLREWGTTRFTVLLSGIWQHWVDTNDRQGCVGQWFLRSR
jgi:hypothetical protein